MGDLESKLEFFRKRGVFMILHIIILIFSAWLVVMISVDTFKGVEFYIQPRFEKWQFWICVVFMADFFIEFFLWKNKWQYLATHLIFFFVAIPYQYLFYHYGWHVSKEISYLIRYIPLIRGGYAMAIVVDWLTSDKPTGLFLTYTITLISTVYFASLTFYLFEHGVNPLVTNYKDAIWWASMDVTTVGSNIVAVTGIGRILSVLLAALGMMMFPIFTVYVTNLITKRTKNATYNASFSLAYKNFVQNQQNDSKHSSSTDTRVAADPTKISSEAPAKAYTSDQE